MSALRDVARGFGLQAQGDPLPGPGVPSGMSYAPGRPFGSIRLVGSLGKAREATFRQIYLMNPWAYAAVNYIARGIGRLPLHVYALDTDGNKTRMRGDIPQTPGRPSAGVALDTLLSNPRSRVSRQAFYGTTLRNRLVYGNALWEIKRDLGGGPAGLELISWSRVEHVEERNGEALWYEIADRYGVDSDRRKLMPGDVVHFGLGADLDCATAPSVLESCQHTLALHEAIMRHLMAYMGNSMRASGHISVDRLTSEKAAQIRQEIIELYTSPENAGSVLVTSGKWESMTDSHDHAQLIDLIKASREEIAGALQVPPPILGLLENAIRANVKEMREQFVRETEGPWASEFEGELMAQLLPQQRSWSNLFVEFQLAEQLRPDLEARALVYQRLMHVYSIDEIRAMENKPPFAIRGVTDVPWIASGALPLTTAARGKSGGTPPGGRDAAEPELGLIAEMLVRLDALEAPRNGHHELSEVT